ncbi:MAG: response regulator transcription factor [Oscillospiraceae bacterium]|jgi:two-component system KDP operon response regulator KdpE|nr:response regulator transcription factor [Oscillospiraceae bacterium]
MAAEASILVVEDEKVISNFLRTVLAAHDYSVLHAATGSEAVSMAASYSPSLMLLDLGLPDIDGMHVLSSVRGWSDMPVIIVSARQDEYEKVAALDAGANDYVTKPFGNSELLARIRTALRQHDKMSGYRMESRFTSGGFVIDYVKRLVSVDHRDVHLTPIEYKIMVMLCRNAGKVLTHDAIIREIWGPFASDTQVLRVNMANIRRKIERNPADPQYILTEVGVGYRMTEADGD